MYLKSYLLWKVFRLGICFTISYEYLLDALIAVGAKETALTGKAVHCLTTTTTD